MSKVGISWKMADSDAEMAELVVRVAQATQADVIICVTESGSFPRQVASCCERFRVVAATATAETYEALTDAGLEVVHLPLHTVDKYRQIRHVLSVALRSSKVSMGEVVVCAVGHDVYLGEANLVVVTEVEPSLEEVAVSDLIKLTDGIRPKTLEAALAIACRIGLAARRGKRLGCILMLGDSTRVLEDSRQLIPNPFHGHDAVTRTIIDPGIHGALIELAKLDGAFVLRGDGFIQTAGVFLAPGGASIEVASGLGARHAAVAAVTARTDATGVVVSATDGNVRVFSGGQMVLSLDPDIEYGPFAMTELGSEIGGR